MRIKHARVRTNSMADLGRSICEAKGLRGETVSMMQAAHSRHRDNSAFRVWIRFGFARAGCILCKAEVCAIVVVIADIFVHEAHQMGLVEHNHIIEQVPAAIANESLRYSVLPRALEAGSFGLDAEALDSVDDFLIEVRAAVEDEVSRRGVVGKCFAQLLDHPSARWVFGGPVV